MRIEVKVPELSESVQGGTLLEWRYKPGDPVKRDDTLVDLETDKVILEVTAPSAGVLVSIHLPAGSEVKSGQLLAEIETEAVVAAPASSASSAVAVVSPPVSQVQEVKPAEPVPANKPVPPVSAPPAPVVSPSHASPSQRRSGQPAPVSPVAVPVAAPAPDARGERREPMSRLRLRIAERLKEAQNTAAMLTTFNEINMQPVMELRSRYQERFQKRHGVKLGFMSLFVKASCKALRDYPMVNAYIEGREIVYHDYLDIGVAVSSERGLVVPVLRNADGLSYADIEKRIADFGKRANSLELKLEEMEGGTFTISNGGVFGSMLSTPILNPPQSAVLGLHKIQDRPVAENGQVVIRPMMYVALSYDHRIIDGREAVSFLKTVKEVMEDPAGLLLDM